MISSLEGMNVGLASPASGRSKSSPGKANRSSMNDHRTALFMRDQRLSNSTNLNQEGSSGLLSVPPPANANREDDDGHSPIGAVLRRRAERRERGGSQDSIPFDSGPMGRASGGDLRANNSRTQQLNQDTKQSSHVSFSVTQHSQNRVYSPAFGPGSQTIVSDTQTGQSGAGGSIADKSPLKKSSHNASGILKTAPSVRSSSPISYTPKGTPPRSAPFSSLGFPAGKRADGVEAPSPLDLGVLPAEYTAPSVFHVMLAEGTSSRSNLTSGPKNHQSSIAPNSLIHAAAVVQGPPTSTASPTFLERTRRNISISVHPASPIDSNSKAHHQKVAETVTLAASPKRQGTTTSVTSKFPTRGLPISPAHLAIAYLDADKYSGGSKFDGNATGNERHVAEKTPSDETEATKGDRKSRTQVDGIRTTRGRAGQESKPQSQTRKGVDPHTKQGAYVETGLLSAVEDLRAETREALIGIHVDIIKTGQAWKVS